MHLNSTEQQREIKIVFFADTHPGFDHPVKPRVQRSRRGEDFFRNYRYVLEYAASSKPDIVVHGGDLFFRTRVQPEIVDVAYEAISDSAVTGTPVLIVPGNHEDSRLPSGRGLMEMYAT